MVFSQSLFCSRTSNALLMLPTTYDLFPEQQSVLKKKTSAHGSPWTKEDVRELKTHSKARTPVARISKLTKRTEGSLRQKALKLGIKLGHRR